MCFIACGLSKQCVFRHNSDIDAWRKILPKGLSNKQQYIYGFMVFTLIDIIGLSHYFIFYGLVAFSMDKKTICYERNNN